MDFNKMTVDLCDYTVEQDIIYDKDERDCQFNDKRKYVVDLYAPKEDMYDVINSKSSHIVDSCVKGYDITPHAIPRRAKAFPTLPYKPNRRLIRTASKFMSRLRKYFHADLSPLRHGF
jgi:hypothetical protein